MGHVPPGSLPSTGSRDELPGPKHRRARTGRPDLDSSHLNSPDLGKGQVGQLGEELACQFLVRQGLRIVERNVRVDRGELDVIARSGQDLIAVEVKTLSQPGDDPFRTFTPAKRRQVRSLAQRYGCTRCDLVVIELHDDGALVRWLPVQ